MDAAAADLEIDVLDRDEAFELFCEIPGFQNMIPCPLRLPLSNIRRGAFQADVPDFA